MHIIGNQRSFGHWSLLTIFVAAWSFVGFRLECSDATYYLEVVLATATLTIVLWENEIRAVRLGAELKNQTRGLLAIFADLLLIASLSALFSYTGRLTVSYTCYDTRAMASEVVSYAEAQRAQIEQQAASRKSLKDVTTGIRLPPAGKITAGYITRDGTIVAISADPPAMIVLLPVMADGAISWTCMGTPSKHVPERCRNPTSVKSPALPPLF